MNEDIQNEIFRKLLDQVSELSNKVKDLESLKNEIPTSEELSKEIKPVKVTKHGPFTIIPFKPKRKRGKAAQPILESEIKEAQEKSKSAKEASRRLNVSYATYRKYAKMYNLHESFINKSGKGVKKPRNPRIGKYPLEDVLDNKFPDYPLYKLKDRLIRAGLKEACCEQCGYNERRITDNKIPLLICFEDNNPKNFNLENLKIFCYNCSFTNGKIWVKIRDRSRWLNDPDRIQGSPRDTAQLY